MTFRTFRASSSLHEALLKREDVNKDCSAYPLPNFHYVGPRELLRGEGPFGNRPGYYTLPAASPAFIVVDDDVDMPSTTKNPGKGFDVPRQE